MRKLNTHARDGRHCRSPQPTGDVLGRWSLLPASIITSEKKANAFQTQLTEQNHSPKHLRRSCFSVVQESLWWLGQKRLGISMSLLDKTVWQSLCNFTSLSSTEGLQKVGKLTCSLLPRSSVFLKGTLKIVPSESDKYPHIDEMVRRTWILLTTNKNSIIDITGFRYNKYMPNWNDIYNLSVSGLLYTFLKNIVLDGQGSRLPNKTSWVKIFLTLNMQVLCHSVDQSPRWLIFFVCFHFPCWIYIGSTFGLFRSQSHSPRGLLQPSNLK